MSPESLEQRLAPRSWAEQVDLTGPREVCEGSDQWGPRHTYRESLMIRTLKRRLEGRKVLNAGCGGGSLTVRLLDEGLQVSSLDASEPFIERLGDRVQQDYPGVDAPVLVGDITGMSFEDGEFDGVTCGEVLEHLDDDYAAVREMARVLLPGGVLVASVPANPWRYDWADHWAGHRRRYTVAGFEELFRGCGLEGVEVIPWGFPLTGLYHRVVYERMVKRRIESAVPGKLTTGAGASKLLRRVTRAALELDTLFLGRAPGYFGLLAAARKPAAPTASER